MTQNISNKLRLLNEGLDQGKWINDKLETTSKNGRFIRILKAIIQPFARLFGGDLFRHIRIHNIVIPLLESVNKNKTAFEADSNLKQRLINVLDKLKKRLKGKHNRKKLDTIQASINYTLGFKIAVTPNAPPPPPKSIEINPDKKSHKQKSTSLFSELMKAAKKRGNKNVFVERNSNPKTQTSSLSLIRELRSNFKKTDSSKFDKFEKIEKKPVSHKVDFRKKLKKTGFKLS